MYIKIFQSQIILFFLLLCSISLDCYSNNSVVVGLFRLTPCSDNPSEYCISMNKEAIIDKAHETLHIPSQIQTKGETYKICQIAAKGFMDCCFIKKLVIDEGIKTVGRLAFYGCSDLRSVSIPSTVSSFGECIFYNCPELISIDVNKANPDFDSREQCNAVIRTSDNAVELGCAGTLFPKSVSQISIRAFCGCTGLVSLNIPEWIEIIEDFAFSDCFSPSNKEWYTNKEKNALICDSTLFAGCYNTTINSDIKRIYASAFNGCRRLTKVFIPASVDRVDARAFSGCVNLVSLVVDPKNKVYDSREDCNCIVESQSNKIICGSSVAVIPKSVSSIGKYAFSGMNTPTVLRIPDNVLKVEEFAFERCNNLYQVVIPANTEINYEAFFDCTRLTSAIYEPQNKSVKTKNDLTFRTSPYRSCTNLMSISSSGENVPHIESGLFKLKN